MTRNGQPMANVSVMFNSRSGSQGSSSGTTDSSGSYQISGLDDGSYGVGVIDIDRSSAYSSTYDVHGSGTFDIDIKTASLRGTVVDSSTGEPLSNAQIQLQSGQGMLSSRAALTDPSGAFFVDNIARGTYHVVAQKDGYGHDMRDITIGDSAPDDLQFKLTPSNGVTINVVDARDNRQLPANVTRIVDASGQVVEAGGGFRVTGSAEPITLTLSPGTYTVTIAAMGYANKLVTVTAPSQITVALTPGGTLVLRSKSSTQQRARLVDSSGAIYRNVTLDPSPLTTTMLRSASGPPSPRFAGRGVLDFECPSPRVQGEEPALSERSESKGAAKRRMRGATSILNLRLLRGAAARESPPPPRAARARAAALDRHRNSCGTSRAV
ncbi:MAG: hypothetical protein DMF58_21225 [Acidobacteria bacterium]|nr:MAG: hypothetical protein DMF58_21225 [Acidobacteriota bacterium]